MRTLMIGSLLVSSCTSALASPATSKAANDRGMAAMGKKNWAAAETEFKTAVAEDPASVKAHYNLASAASRAHDRPTALLELVWVLDRAGWDDEAKAAAKKVASDADLAWMVKDWDPSSIGWLGTEPMTAPIDLVQPKDSAFNGHALADSKRAATLAAASGAHDAKCDAADARQGKVFALELHLGKFEKMSALASLKDGLAVVDTNGAVVARSEPLGCTGPGESQDQLATLSAGNGVPLEVDLTDKDVPTRNIQLLAVSYTNGGRREWQTRVVVFAPRDKTLVKVFEATLASSDTTGAGHLWQSALGNLIFQGPGETKKQAFHWDPTKFAFVP